MAAGRGAWRVVLCYRLGALYYGRYVTRITHDVFIVSERSICRLNAASVELSSK